jgi:hypothetical protein
MIDSDQRRSQIPAPNHARELALSDRRQSLLKAIRADDLYRMRERVDGTPPRGEMGGRMGSDIVRVHVLENWDRYVEELKRWCDFTITGESTL